MKDFDYNDFAESLYIASIAHKGQFRKGDYNGNEIPYIIHPFKVTEMIANWTDRNYFLMSIAILHDVLEDADVDDLPYYKSEIEKIDSILVNYVENMSNNKGTYEEYIKELSHDIFLMLIKTADAIANVNDSILLKGEVGEKIKKKNNIIYKIFSEYLNGDCINFYISHEKMAKTLNEKLVQLKETSENFH